MEIPIREAILLGASIIVLSLNVSYLIAQWMAKKKHKFKKSERIKPVC